jgi:conjugative transfer signal peptidase TraF
MTKHPGSNQLAILRAWGDHFRAVKRSRQKLGRRIALTAGGITALGLTIAIPPRLRLVWNTSASAPIGLYAVTPGAPVDVGDMVIARVPEPWRLLAARRRYIPANVPLVKRVTAGPGDEVCALSAEIFVDGQWAATRQSRDRAGRIMPWWNGCSRLHAHEYFLLMSGNAASFDGRYFGVTSENLLLGKAHLLWVR